MDKHEYLKYRNSRRQGDDYFQEGTFHKEEHFALDERLFVWDQAKNEANIAVHGVGFYTAAYVFNDEFRLEDDNSVVDGNLGKIPSESLWDRRIRSIP